MLSGRSTGRPAQGAGSKSGDCPGPHLPVAVALPPHPTPSALHLVRLSVGYATLRHATQPHTKELPPSCDVGVCVSGAGEGGGGGGRQGNLPTDSAVRPLAFLFIRVVACSDCITGTFGLRIILGDHIDSAIGVLGTKLTILRPPKERTY